MAPRPKHLFHGTLSIRVPVCRIAGCSNSSCQRYGPNHGWNELCEGHADDVARRVEATVKPKPIAKPVESLSQSQERANFFWGIGIN